MQDLFEQSLDQYNKIGNKYTKPVLEVNMGPFE